MRGYHIYCSIWDASVDEVLSCKQEASNPRDPYAVSVVKPGTGIYYARSLGERSNMHAHASARDFLHARARAIMMQSYNGSILARS